MLLPLFHSFMADIPLCVCLFIEALLRRLHAEAPGEGPSCLFQRLGAPGGPGLVAASLPSLRPSSRGFSSVSPLVSLMRTLSLDGGLLSDPSHGFSSVSSLL